MTMNHDNKQLNSPEAFTPQPESEHSSGDLIQKIIRSFTQKPRIDLDLRVFVIRCTPNKDAQQGCTSSSVGAVASCCGAVVERIVWLQQTNLCPWKNPEAASNRQVGNKPTLHPYYLNLSLEVKVKSKSNYRSMTPRNMQHGCLLASFDSDLVQRNQYHCYRGYGRVLQLEDPLKNVLCNVFEASDRVRLETTPSWLLQCHLQESKSTARC
ncbi:hypothetical protein F2P81_014487 [Scophthalmus maximus]|uniref:Uncharacterized protein n=1 Tax=Scophthalmus maximus TaxID=52904 RepID=A0A6A4SG11_SCOMX|nr:hypothetical protein F2P81_014487 [Scophthalmus maximus]